MLNPTITVKDYKVGSIRNGGSRVWLDTILKGKRNWANGCRYDREVSDTGTITLTSNPDGKYKVSGGNDRPVIDLSGKWVAMAMQSASRCNVILSDNSIVIYPN